MKNVKAKRSISKKAVKRIIIVSVSVILALAIAIPLFILGGIWGVLDLSRYIIYPEYYSIKTDICTNPGLSDGFVCQGIAAYEAKFGGDKILVSGYMKDGEASRIYITDAKNTSNTSFVELYTADGQPYTGHTGGITSSSGIVWLTNDGEGDDNCMWVFTLAELLSSKDGKVTLKTKFQPESRAACNFADGTYLWVGEFNDGEKYVTKESHTFGENKALVCAYKIDASSKYGIEFETVEGKDVFTPALALSVTDLVQGFTRSPDGFALSTSYSVKASHLLFYSDVTKGSADASISINGHDVPVYILDGEAMTKDVWMPPMSEEIFVKDGRVFVLFESACQKYIFGNFTHGIYTFSYKLPE